MEFEHTIEEAPSGRAKCRGCGLAIPKGSLRLGERLPNPFSDATPLTLWFHLECAAFKRPETFLQTVAESGEQIEDVNRLTQIATFGADHKRVPRINGAQRAPSGRAKCRQCKETIGKDEWRISLVYFEDGRFNPSGYVHPACSTEYFGTRDILTSIRKFGVDLSENDVTEIDSLLDG
ncbi:MAG: hypothetical protein HKN43_17315 [Rhodothermales bacterium]|nr:hypothetical protein [Rhodothermales bacterium]